LLKSTSAFEVDYNTPVLIYNIFVGNPNKSKPIDCYFRGKHEKLQKKPTNPNETISHGRAAEILGISKCELIELYGSEGFPYIDQSWDEAEQDAANVMELLESYRR